MDKSEGIRIAYRGPIEHAGILGELIGDDAGRLRWELPPGADGDLAIGMVWGLDIEHVIGAAQLFMGRFPDARVRVDGADVEPLAGAEPRRAPRHDS